MISIIIPVYNVEEYLDECFLSVKKQTYKNYEIIIVNDGSSDSSLNKCLQFKDENPEIIVRIIDKQNEGVTAARRDGVLAAQGEWIMFMDADDMLEVDALQILSSNITNNVNIIIGSHSLLINEEKTFKPNRSIGLANHSEYIDLFLQSKVEGVPWAKLFRKEVFSLDIFNLPKDIKVKEDVIMNFRIACRQNRDVLFINNPLYIYRWLRIDSAMYSAKKDDINISYELQILNYISQELKKKNLYEHKKRFLAMFYFRNVCSWRKVLLKQNTKIATEIKRILKWTKAENPYNFSHIKYLYLMCLCHCSLTVRILYKH